MKAIKSRFVKMALCMTTGTLFAQGAIDLCPNIWTDITGR